jgi:nucleotide-binding universal stress UspA family protein
MFKQVMVGVDEHQGGRDAIALAKLLVASDGELNVAHVYLGDPTLVRPSGGTFGDGERKRGRELFTAVRDESGVDAKLLCTASSSVGRGLHEVVEAQGADLLVVSSCQRSFIGRALVGDDTRDALNGAPCAIAVAPFGYSQHSAVTSKIGVGYNGSPESVHALSVARELASEHGARVSAFEVVLLSDYPFGPDSGPVDTAISAFVDQARARIAAFGDIEPHAGYGGAAEELALYGASVDLLIVGSRGYGPIGRLVHGSTSQRLTRIARCPLLVLSRAAPQVDRGNESRVAAAAVDG